MRAFVITISALVMMTAQSQALDCDTLSINQNPVPAEATASFSIGYPKGWWVSQDYGQERQDIYFDIPSGSYDYDPLGMICNFSQPGTNVLQHGDTSFTVFLSQAATAKEAAEKFFKGQRTVTAYMPKKLSPVRTSAGVSGLLVESEGYLITDPAITKLMSDAALLKSTNALHEMLQMEKNLKPSQETPVIYHDFFFHSGNKGAIRIQIMTRAANPPWRAELDQLVLQTLRF